MPYLLRCSVRKDGIPRTYGVWIFERVPHPSAPFALGWDSTNLSNLGFWRCAQELSPRGIDLIPIPHAAIAVFS